MFKKFLNAILFGALILGSAGTITSCKDYDDEIDEINQKLNTLSSKDELAAQVSSLTSTISAAQSAAAQASTEAANALTAAKEAAAQAEQAATGAGQATGQAAEAINNAKAAATAADAAAKTAADAAAKAKAASEDAAKAVAAGADATKAIAEAKAAAEAAQKAAADAKAGVEAAQKAAAEAAKSAVADAQKEIAEAAKKVAEEAAKEAAAAASKAELAELAKRIEALEKGADVKELAEEVAAAKEKVDAIVGKIAGAVTEVSLVDSYTAAQVLAQYAQQEKSSLYPYYRSRIVAGQGTFANFYYELVQPTSEYGYTSRNQDNPLDLNFTTVFEAADITVAQGWSKWMTEYEAKPINFPGLGADLKDAITFKKDRQVNRPDAFVVRVSPTNAVVTPEMISLVNSQGVNLDEILEVKKVTKFDGLLSRPDGVTPVTRAAEETGLWVVEVALKEYNEETFYPLTMYMTDYDSYNDYLLSAVNTRATVNQDGNDPHAGEKEYKMVNKILYAVQVNNTAEDAADRYVTSSYDLTLDWGAYQPANRLHFSVNTTPVEKINNRFDENSISFYPYPNTDQEYAERTWLANKVDVKPNIFMVGAKGTTDKNKNADATENVTDDTYEGVGYANNDNRSSENMLAVAPGEKFTVTLDEFQGWAYEEKYGESTYSGVMPVSTKSAVRAMYVVLDQPNSVESIPSEWNAWMTYEYTGINEVVEGTSIDITVSGDELISKRGDIIGFRVYGINWDGTLVDPDGRAFYVNVGDAQSANSAATVIYPVSEQDFDDLEVGDDEWPISDPVEFTVSTVKANHFIWNADVISYFDRTEDQTTGDGESELKKSLAFYPVFAQFKDKKLNDIQAFNVTETTDEDGNPYIEGDITGALKDVNMLYTVPMIGDWLAYIDGKEYSGTLTLQSVESGLVRTLATIKITFKKELPTTAPKGYSPKDKQIIDGLYVSYLQPESWAAKSATYGTMPMPHVFDFGTKSDDVTSLAPNYNITFAQSAYKTTTKVDGDGNEVTVIVVKDGKPVIEDVTVAGDEILSIHNDFIDNQTKHATSVVYNFGKISTALYNKEKDVYADYTVDVDKFETEFHDIYDKLYTWHWATKKDLGLTDKQALPYKTAVKYGAGSGQTGDDPQFTVDLQYILGVCAPDGLYDAPLSAPYKGSLEIADAALTSDANGKEEYFDIQVNGSILEFIPAEIATGTEFNGASNPKADVPSTLHIKLIDMYSHKTHEATVPMTVLKR